VTGDIPAAALRLSSALPVRTHVRREPLYVQGSHVTRALLIDGLTFRSRLAAKQHFHIGNTKLDSWIAEGKAKII